MDLSFDEGHVANPASTTCPRKRGTWHPQVRMPPAARGRNVGVPCSTLAWTCLSRRSMSPFECQTCPRKRGTWHPTIEIAARCAHCDVCHLHVAWTCRSIRGMSPVRGQQHAHASVGPGTRYENAARCAHCDVRGEWHCPSGAMSHACVSDVFGFQGGEARSEERHAHASVGHGTP